MELSTTNLKVGETVTLQRSEKVLKKSGTTIFKKFISSRYVCIRESANGQPGILVKVLGKTPATLLTIIDGKPYVKDDSEHLFYDTNYYSFPFPKGEQVEEALSIIRNNAELIKQFESLSMHVNTEATFWVRDTTRNLLLKRQLHYLDAKTNQTCTATESDAHYRLSIVYYDDSALVW
jgi:hypothetical protein